MPFGFQVVCEAVGVADGAGDGVEAQSQMPYSHELAEGYSDEDVVFLYLALNDTKDKWEKAVEALGLNEIGESFLVLNSKDNSWTKDMNVSTVPRYMIYDRMGNLVDSNAPRPSSDEIRNELDKFRFDFL